jgi:3-hydroxyacyl-CoA dehydrogenase/enoyl-CoA hydratase/3-hydroxybutyryl-CoA epimerase/enoyl-CoA isomerase
MDEQGLDVICEKAENYSAIGELYQPTESMRAMASKGKKFYP